MKTVQQWFVTVALATIGVIIVLIILSAQFALIGSADSNPTPVQRQDSQISPASTLIPPTSEFVGSPSPLPPPTIAPAETEHTVQSGESLSAIAGQYGCAAWQNIATHNQIGEPYALDVGQVLKIPDPC